MAVMNLTPRILLITGVLIVVSAMAAWWASHDAAVRIIEGWGSRYAEKQVLYDKLRILQPIQREIALARELVSSEQILAWVRRPDDAGLTRQAIAVMERFRLSFADHSYFFALRGSGRYYHNNAADEYAGHQFRYVLDPRKPEDRWFYDIIRQQRDVHINVNPDVNLGVTKLWVDMLVRDGGRIVGVAGTGLDLTAFIRNVVEDTEPGITTLFVDHVGAIQLYRDERLIDYASITKKDGQHRALDLLFQRPADREAIRAAMTELAAQQTTVVTRFVSRDGKRYLAGIAYLPEIGWYEINLMDLDVLLPIGSFAGLLLVYVLTLLAALAVFNLVLRRLVVRPITQLEDAVARVRDDSFAPDSLPDGGSGEIGRLMRHFRDMARSVRLARQDLEDKVRQRTEALDHLSKTDTLTGLLNRRGLTERVEAQISLAAREGRRFGVLWLDVDRFKEINDRHGHLAGDHALAVVAGLIRTSIRPYDSAARWGGDEFMVVVHNCDEPTVTALGERIRAAVADAQVMVADAAEPVRLSVSVGATTAAGGVDFETILQNADHALYAAKEAGRDCLRYLS